MALENKEIFSKNLQHYMEQNNVSRKDIASELSVGYMTVYDWVNAKTYPRIDKIEMLARMFGVEKSRLIEEFNPDNTLDMINSICSQLNDINQKLVYDYAKDLLEKQGS